MNMPSPFLFWPKQKPILMKKILNLSISNLKIILIAITALTTISIFFLAPIPQDPSYHQFVDQRTILSIPNFWNVVSNV
jgi:hypothetical protein